MSILNLENKNILVVEDDEMSFLYLNQLLLLTKSKFERVINGTKALEKFSSNDHYDLILMDIQLPDMDGKEVTREIRRHDKIIPVVAQTASRSTHELDLIMEAGCTAILTKPFSMDDFYETIRKLIG